MFSRGYNLTSTGGVTLRFTAEAPLIGLLGYETQDKVKGLGFIKYDCGIATADPGEESYFYGDSLYP